MLRPGRQVGAEVVHHAQAVDQVGGDGGHLAQVWLGLLPVPVRRRADPHRGPRHLLLLWLPGPEDPHPAAGATHGESWTLL